MPKILSNEQVEQYHRDGFFAPLSALDENETAQFRAAFEAYEAAFEGWYEMSKGQKLYLLQRWARDLAEHPRILDAVEDVMGPNLMVWGLSLFVKDAQTPSYVSWHQDSTYWGLSKPNVTTAWGRPFARQQVVRLHENDAGHTQMGSDRTQGYFGAGESSDPRSGN